MAAPQRDFPNTADAYQLGEMIGKGACGLVMRATCKPLNKQVAVKLIDLESCPSNIDDIRKEITQMKLCSHPNVVSYYCSFVDGQYLWLIMKFFSGGSVLDIMKYKFPNGLQDEALIATILREALKGIEYLHKTGRIHRDVKAGNLLVSTSGNVTLADFGVSAWLVENGLKLDVRQTFVGTPCWMAPEVMEQVRGYDYKADIWSLGITALELARGSAPLAQYPPMKVLLLTLQNPPPTLEGGWSTPFQKMVESCLQKEPAKRPSASKLLEHKFFKQAKKADYVAEQLLKGLPPLWERTQVTMKKDPAVDELLQTVASGEVSREKGSSWNFDGPASLENAVQPGTVPTTTPTQSAQESGQQIVQAGRFTVKTEIATDAPSQPTATPAATSGAEPTVIGRFVVKPTDPSQPPTAAQVAGAAVTKPRRGSTVHKPARGTPLDLLSELQKQIVQLLNDNARLTKENTLLKKELDSLKKGQ